MNQCFNLTLVSTGLLLEIFIYSTYGPRYLKNKIQYRWTLLARDYDVFSCVKKRQMIRNLVNFDNVNVMG